MAPGLIVDWSARDEPLGLEVLGFRERLGAADLESYVAGLLDGLFASRAEAAE